jgi:hypothetical protein
MIIYKLCLYKRGFSNISEHTKHEQHTVCTQGFAIFTSLVSESLDTTNQCLKGLSNEN